jgi:hypothetical protein
VFSIFDMLLNASFVFGISVFALVPVIADNALITSSLASGALLVSAYLIREKSQKAKA